MKRIFGGCAALCAIATSCTTAQRVEAERALAEVLVSDEQESQLGLQVHQELEKKQVQFSNDATVTAYVQSLLNQLTPTAARERPVEWRLYVIDDSKVVNAFATPGGRIYVYTGLVRSAGNEAEIVGVLGHEMGHVVARHSARQLIAAYGLETVVRMALGDDPNDIAAIAATLAAKGAMLAYGRSEETEADEHGAKYAAAAGYDPMGIANFFSKLLAQQGRTPEFLVWLSSHPSHEARVAHVTAYVAANQLTGAKTGAESLRAIQARLK